MCVLVHGIGIRNVICNVCMYNSLLIVSKWMVGKLVNVKGFVVNDVQILINVARISDVQITLLDWNMMLG